MLIRRFLTWLIVPPHMRRTQLDLSHRVTAAETTLHSLSRDLRNGTTINAKLQARILELENALRHVDDWRHAAKALVSDAYTGKLDLYALKRIIMDSLYAKKSVKCPECVVRDRMLDELRAEQPVPTEPDPAFYARSGTGTLHRVDVSNPVSIGSYDVLSWCGLEMTVVDIQRGPLSDGMHIDALCGNCRRMEKARQ